MNGVLLGIGAYFLEIIKLFCIMYFVLRFEMKSKRWGILWILGLCVPAGVLGGSGSLTYAAYLSLLAAFLVFQGRGKILYGIFTYFSIGFFDSLCTSVIRLVLDVNYISYVENENIRFLFNSASLVVLPFIIVASLHRQKREIITAGRRINRKWLLFVLAGELALMLFIELFQYAVAKDNRVGNIMMATLCIGSVVFVVAMVLLIISVTTREHYKELAGMNERLLESQAEYYEMMLEKENETRAFQHDMKNHLYCMRSLLEECDYEGLKSYFDTIGVLLEQLRSTIQTGNEMLNVILNNVVVKYPTVTYTVEGVLSGNIGLENHDLCAIFFNLLENAFTAAAKSEEKRVWMCFTEREEMCFCVIKNTVLRSVEIRDNRMQTEKEDAKYHGYGTVNAVKCAKQNGGELRFSCEGKEFSAELLLFKKSV